MRVLITGAAGFVGIHLTRLLNAEGHDVHALVLPSEKLPPDLADIPTHDCDITDPSALEVVLAKTEPEWTFHLAAISRPGACHDNPTLAWNVNFLGTHNLYSLASRITPDARVLFIGSAVEYGKPPADRLPLTEESPLDPQDVYAATKVAGDLVGGEFSLSGKLSVIRARSFNHIGPGQEPGFVAPDFARQVARIEQGRQTPVMQVGHLDLARDFTDVRDVVRAYVLLMKTGEPGRAYNVCSEKTHTVRELLDGLLALCTVGAEVEVNSRKSWSGEADTVVGSAQALRDATGWTPEIPFEQTLRDLLDDWRIRVKSNLT